MHKAMKAGTILILSLGLFLYGFYASHAAEADEGVALVDPRPNIILILLENTSYGDLGSYGNTTIQTPSLDQLAAEGMRFTQFYSSGVVCSPTRAAILSGIFPAAFGLRKALSGNSRRGLPAQPHSLARLLKGQGYATGHIGKWHMGDWHADFRPAAHGFDFSVTQHGPLWHEPQTYINPTLIRNDTELVFHEGHLTNVLTNYAIAFISRAHQQGKPFFLHLSYLAAHAPFEPTARWSAQYPNTLRGKFAALLSHADEQIGRLVAYLSELGIADDTVIMVTSDHGGSFNTHANNGTSRGFKGEVFEGGIRVPAIVRWPGVVSAGTVADAVLTSIDFLPTFAEIAGVPADQFSVPGKSFMPVLYGTVPSARQELLFWEDRSGETPVEDADGRRDNFAVRQRDWKLVSVDGEKLLFNLAIDPEESTNQAARRPEKVTQLLDAYDAWRLAISYIPHAVAYARGGVIVQDTSAYFFTTPGTVGLQLHPLFNIHDGDFTSRIAVTPTQIGTPQILAQRQASWRLWLASNGQVCLRVWQNNRRWITLRSKTMIQANHLYIIAFTVRGHTRDDNNAEIQLIIDGNVEDQSNTLKVIQSSDSPIIFGSMSDAYAYLGSIAKIAFFNVALRLSEL